MKKLGMLLCVCILATGVVSGYDLFEYPSPFAFENDKIDTILVTGNGADATHVIAMTNVQLSLTAYTDDLGLGRTKLASEVTSLNQNIISFGNACDSEISAKILNNPDPCYEGYEYGKASIKAVEHEEYVHLVVAGRTSLGTTKAAEKLENFKVANLRGEEFVIDVDEPIIQEEDPQEKEQPPEPAEQTQPQTTTDEDETEPDQTEEEQPIEEAPPVVQIPVEEKGFFGKIVDWFKNLFR